MKRSSNQSRLVKLVGSDADYLYFTTPSWSRKDLKFDITIDKETGEIRCSCEDAVCRAKRPYLLDMFGDEKPVHCKHVAGLIIAYRRLLGG